MNTSTLFAQVVIHLINLEGYFYLYLDKCNRKDGTRASRENPRAGDRESEAIHLPRKKQIKAGLQR